jgi:hypothetical protein
MSAGYGDLLGKTVLYSAANASEVLRSPLTFFSLFNSFFARPTSSIPPLCHFKSVLGFSHFVTHQLARLLPKQCNPFVWTATSNSAPTLWQLTTQHRLGLVGASGVLGVLACTVFFSNKRLLLLIPFFCRTATLPTAQHGRFACSLFSSCCAGSDPWPWDDNK